MLTALEPLELVVERRMLHKMLNIMDNSTHHLHKILVRQQSLQLEAPSAILQSGTLQEVIPVHRKNMCMQLLRYWQQYFRCYF